MFMSGSLFCRRGRCRLGKEVGNPNTTVGTVDDPLDFIEPG